MTDIPLKHTNYRNDPYAVHILLLMKGEITMDALGMVAPTGLIQDMSVSLASAKAGNETGVAMLSKALDTQDSMGASMIHMMEQSVNPAVGGNFDMSV